MKHYTNLKVFWIFNFSFQPGYNLDINSIAEMVDVATPIASKASKIDVFETDDNGSDFKEMSAMMSIKSEKMSQKIPAKDDEILIISQGIMKWRQSISIFHKETYSDVWNVCSFSFPK